MFVGILRLTKLPSYILVENVKGFDTSETKAELVDTLENCGYQIQVCELVLIDMRNENA